MVSSCISNWSVKNSCMEMMLTNPSAASACAAAAGMYPWYRPTSAHGHSAMAHADSMSQLGQFCSSNGPNSLPTIKTENGYGVGLSHHGLSSSGSSNGGRLLIN